MEKLYEATKQARGEVEVIFVGSKKDCEREVAYEKVRNKNVRYRVRPLEV